MILMIKRYADGSDNICMVKRGFIYLCAFESFCYWKYIVRILVICIDAKKGVFTHTPNTPSFIYRLRGVMKCCMLWWQKSYIRFDHFGVECLDLVYSLMMKRWVCGGMKKKKREGCCIKWDLFHYLPWMRVKLLHTSTSLGYLWVPHGSKGPLILPFHSPPTSPGMYVCIHTYRTSLCWSIFIHVYIFR